MKTVICKCEYCKSELIRRVCPSIKSKFHFCNNTCKGEYQRTFKPVTKEWLYEHYIEKQLNTTEIAHIVQRDPKSVWNWLKDFGIPTRGRGTDKRQQFKKGDNNYFKGKKHTKETKDKIRACRLKDGHVPYLKDGKHWLKTKGAIHPNWKGGISPDRQSFYCSFEWGEAVKEVWKRDNAICQKCGKKHNTPESRGTFHIHHIVSFRVKKLRANVNNLVLLCKNCHRWVHSKKNINKEFIIKDKLYDTNT
jgi:hypothetical protein